MILPDANILLYVVNRDAPHHAVLHRWWEGAVNGDEPVALAWLVMLAFLRLSTHPKVFDRPLTATEAVNQIDAWLSHPNIRVVVEAENHWPILRNLVQTSGTAANLTSDAHLAAVALGHDLMLASCDGDFARFPGLRWINPLHED